MAGNDARLVVARYGEIALKGRNQPAFLRQLRRNMREALRHAGADGELVVEGRRLHVLTHEPEAALAVLSRVFGITSLSPATRTDLDLDAITEAALAGVTADGVGPERSLRVRARRSNKAFPYTSPEINRLVGEQLLTATNARVDLSDGADVTVGVEVQADHALVFSRTVPGAGGLPVPLSGKVIALFSTGIDSAVAAWMMMKRGCGVIPLHFATDMESQGKLGGILDQLQAWSTGWKLRPTTVSHHEALDQVADGLRARREERWTCLFCKRAMIAAAERLALEVGAQGIVLGDSLGQVASQTLENLRVISDGITLPIYRPLIGLDKVEIMALARRIGTYDLSVQDQHACKFLPARPLTQASFARFQELVTILEADQDAT